MFEKLVVSTSQRRRGRTAKFFVCTSFIYLAVAGAAVALSILLATPKIADTSVGRLDGIIFPTGGARQTSPERRQTKVTPAKDPRNVEPLERIIRNLGHTQTPAPSAPPRAHEGLIEADLPPGDGRPGIPGIPSTGRDMSLGNVTTDPPRPPDPPKAQPRSVDNARPLPVSSTVLQGKAIDRIVPVYPELPKRIRLQGEVSLEVIISPEGRVESARVVSGHPLLTKAATDAAKRWRFEPTLLNGVAVRVTGVITFVFKLSE